MAVRPSTKTLYRLRARHTVGVPFHHRQIGPLVILQDHSRVLAGEQLHMVLGRVQQVIRHSGGFTGNKRVSGLPADFTCAKWCGPDTEPQGRPRFGKAVGHAAQGRPVRALLYKCREGSLELVNHKLGLLAAVQVDGALGVVHDMLGTQFRHDVGGIGGGLLRSMVPSSRCIPPGRSCCPPPQNGNGR